jgi:hypothetical protein
MGISATYSTHPQTPRQSIETLPVLTLRFPDLRLYPDQVPQWRGAVNAGVPADLLEEYADLFHNHAGMDRTYKRYPLVQYGVTRGVAAILGVGRGAGALTHWYMHRPKKIRIEAVEYDITTVALDVLDAPLGVGDNKRTYMLYDYLPFNHANYLAWQAETSMVRRIQQLEQLLAAHIIQFAKGVDWQVPGRFVVEMEDVREIAQQYALKPGNCFQRFDLRFRSDIVLPRGIGLGNKVAYGMGCLDF